MVSEVLVAVLCLVFVGFAIVLGVARRTQRQKTFHGRSRRYRQVIIRHSRRVHAERSRTAFSGCSPVSVKAVRYPAAWTYGQHISRTEISVEADTAGSCAIQDMQPACGMKHAAVAPSAS